MTMGFRARLRSVVAATAVFQRTIREQTIGLPFALLEQRLSEQLVNQFIEDDAIWFPGIEELQQYALSQVTIDGLFLEFGVWNGDSIRRIAKQVKGPVHGFDSFRGLPEKWIDGYEEGMFSRDGILPDVPGNVKLHVGWFEDTLSVFVRSHSGPVAFVNIDSDLYSSAATVLHELGDRIVPGTVILFDDYFNFPEWQFGEFRAWNEHVHRHKIRYRFFGLSGNNSTDRSFNQYGRVAIVVE